jgi:hypothetical protein
MGQLPTSSLPDRSDLDNPELGGGMLRGNFNRLVEIGAFYDVIARHLVLDFGKRTVTDQQLSIAHANRLCLGCGS